MRWHVRQSVLVKVLRDRKYLYVFHFVTLTLLANIVLGHLWAPQHSAK